MILTKYINALYYIKIEGYQFILALYSKYIKNYFLIFY